MDILIMVLCVIELFLFIDWLSLSEDSTSLIICAGIAIVLIGICIGQPYARFTISPKMVTDHYANVHLEHNAAIFSVEAYRKGCYLISETRTVIFDNPNSNPPSDEIISRIKDSK